LFALLELFALVELFSLLEFALLSLSERVAFWEGVSFVALLS
jgi:hypothetical protein